MDMRRLVICSPIVLVAVRIFMVLPSFVLLSIPTIGVMLIVVRTIVDEGLLSLVYCSRELSH